MSAEENLVSIRHLAAAINRHDPTAAAALFATAGTFVSTSGEKAEGRPAVEAQYRTLFAAFPDAQVVTRGIMTPRPGAALVEYTLSGTQLGPVKTPGGEIAATGRTVSLQQVATFTFNATGQIQREENVGDNLALLLQLGQVQILSQSQLQGVAEKLISACNKRDAAAVAACCAELATETFNGESVSGRAAIQQAHAETFSAFPDLRITAQDVLVDGQRIAITARMQGTNSGARAAGPATGKAIDVPITLVADVNSGGLIMHLRDYYDQGAIMAQLGLLPGAR